jgi:hypothetical protein
MTALFIFLVLIVLLLIISLLVKKDYSLTKEIVINKPKTEVFDYIKHLKNQNNYSKWALMDPHMQSTFTGTDAAPGFVSAWEGNKKVGKGSQEIKRITEGQKIETEIHFIKPFESTMQSYMTTDSIAPAQTKVSWNISGHSKWPMNLMNLFMDKMVGGDLTTGLQNLKNIQEKQ